MAMHSNDWSFAGGYCKIKTARQKKRSLKTDRDNNLMRLARRRSKLWEQRASQPLVPLEEPYQRGWKCSFILREDVALSKQNDFCLALLDKLNTVQYSTTRSFTKRKRRRGKKMDVPRPQYLREYMPDRHGKLPVHLTEAEMEHFHWEECRSSDGKTVSVKLVYNCPWQFVLQVRPCMVTHRRLIDRELEHELQHLENHIAGNRLGGRIHRLTQGHRDWKRHVPDLRHTNTLKNKPLRDILAAIENDQLL